MSDSVEKAGLGPLFDPETIAVVGASNDIHKFGGRPIHYMQQGGYDGVIYPINPKGGEIQGHTAYADIREAPSPADMSNGRNRCQTSSGKI